MTVVIFSLPLWSLSRNRTSSFPILDVCFSGKHATSYELLLAYVCSTRFDAFFEKLPIRSGILPEGQKTNRVLWWVQRQLLNVAFVCACAYVCLCPWRAMDASRLAAQPEVSWPRCGCGLPSMLCSAVIGPPAQLHGHAWLHPAHKGNYTRASGLFYLESKKRDCLTASAQDPIKPHLLCTTSYLCKFSWICNFLSKPFFSLS